MVLLSGPGKVVSGILAPTIAAEAGK